MCCVVEVYLTKLCLPSRRECIELCCIRWKAGCAYQFVQVRPEVVVAAEVSGRTGWGE